MQGCGREGRTGQRIPPEEDVPESVRGPYIGGCITIVHRTVLRGPHLDFRIDRRVCPLHICFLPHSTVFLSFLHIAACVHLSLCLSEGPPLYGASAQAPHLQDEDSLLLSSWVWARGAPTLHRPPYPFSAWGRQRSVQPVDTHIAPPSGLSAGLCTCSTGDPTNVALPLFAPTSPPAPRAVFSAAR